MFRDALNTVLFCALWVVGGQAAFTSQSLQAQAPPEASTPPPAVSRAVSESDPQSPTVAAVAASSQPSVAGEQESKGPLQELEKQRQALDERLSATRAELEQLNRQAEAAAEQRTAAVREEIERLEGARRRIEESERQERDARRRLAQEQHSADGEDSAEWRSRSRARRSAEPKVGFGTTVKVRKGDVVRDVISVMGGAKVDGEVLGDVTTFGRAAKVNGRVTGSVTALGGNVELGPKAVVEGDVTAVGGKVVEAPGAEVKGEINGGVTFDIGDVSDLDVFGRSRSVRSIIGWADWVEFFWALIFTGFLALLSALIYLVFRRPVERVRDAAFDAPLKSFLIGFLILVLSVPAMVAVMIVLAISIIGIPILVILVLLSPFVLIAFFVALLYGYSAVALGVGGFLRSQMRLGLGSSLVMVILGVFALRAMGLSGDLLDAIGLPGFVTIWFGFASILIQFGALSVALGAVVSSRFGLGTGPSVAVIPPVDLPPVPEFQSDADLDPDNDESTWMDDPLDGEPGRRD